MPAQQRRDLLMATAQVLLTCARHGRSASSQDLCSALNLLLFASHECHLVAFVRSAASDGVKVLGTSRIDPTGEVHHCPVALDDLVLAIDGCGTVCPTPDYDLVSLALDSRTNPNTYLVFGMLAPSECQERLGILRNVVRLTSIYLDQHRLTLATDAASLPSVGQPDLSSRQLRIVELMAEGMTNNQIAHRIRYSPSLVRHEGQAIFRILGVSDRRSAVERALELGLIEQVTDTDGLLAG